MSKYMRFARETVYEKDYDKKMSVMYIDNAGISINQTVSGSCFFVCERTTYDDENKLILKCITEITKHNNKLLLDEKKLANSLYIQKTFDEQNRIHLNVKSGSIYRLKIIINANESVLCILASTQIFGDLIAMLKKKDYKINGIYMFGNVEMKANVLASSCGFGSGINEIKIKEECKKNDNNLLEKIALHNFFVRNKNNMNKDNIINKIREEIKDQINDIKEEILSENNRYDLYMMISVYEYIKNNKEEISKEEINNEIEKLYEKIKENQ